MSRMHLKIHFAGKTCKEKIKEVQKIKKMDKPESELHLNSSSSLEDSDIVHITAPESSTHLSVTTVLNYCKSKILTPYLRFLSFLGLRPFLDEQQDASVYWKIFNVVYVLLSVGVMIVGYILQYLSCFRRERGFCYMYMSGNETLLKSEYQAIFHETCEASIVFSFVLPSLLHLIAYLHLVLVFRNTDDEQLPILMERVFLASTSISNGFISQRRLVKALWVCFSISLIWITFSSAVVFYMMANGEVYFKYMKLSSSNISTLLKIVLVASTLWHDLIQCTIISNYCLQAQLLRSYLRFMREKLLQFPVAPLEWMRDIEDFKKLLHYFNKKISPSVCLLTVRNVAFALSGTVWVFHYDLIDKESTSVFGVSLINILLWTIIALVPFVQAARLSNSCEVLKTVGQEARARPYVHTATPTVELDSVMLYTTSLRINAKLFYVPITGRIVFFSITLTGITFLTLGQCHYFDTK